MSARLMQFRGNYRVRYNHCTRYLGTVYEMYEIRSTGSIKMKYLTIHQMIPIHPFQGTRNGRDLPVRRPYAIVTTHGMPSHVNPLDNGSRIFACQRLITVAANGVAMRCVRQSPPQECVPAWILPRKGSMTLDQTRCEWDLHALVTHHRFLPDTCRARSISRVQDGLG